MPMQLQHGKPSEIAGENCDFVGKKIRLIK